MPTNRRRRWGRIAILACLLVLAILGTCLTLAAREPSWWQEPTPSAETASEAQQIENVLVSELTQARPDDGATPEYRSAEWDLTITEKEANAWLANRAKEWVENRAGNWPQSVQSVQLAFRPGRLLVGFHLKQDGFDHVISVIAVPEWRADGSLWLRASNTALGGLPLPTGLILNQVQSIAGASSNTQIVDALDGKRPLLEHATVKLSDGRLVRIVKAVAQDGQVTLTCRTEKN